MRQTHPLLQGFYHLVEAEVTERGGGVVEQGNLNLDRSGYIQTTEIKC